MKRWIYKPLPPTEDVQNLSSAINVNPILSTILLQRGITDFDSAKNFFRPTPDQLHDPFLMKGMSAAVDRLQQAVTSREKILIYGDYDVDGTTAVALVYSCLREFYNLCEIYIPDRQKEGYGISEQGIAYAAQEKYTLIIALDCGIKSTELIRKASEEGIEFIVCDHHLPGEEIPGAVAVLDPKQEDCQYPYKELSGCGIGFKLMQAFFSKYKPDSNVFKYIDLVAISIASDIVPITGENRVMTSLGMKKLNDDPLPGLKALKEISGLRDELDVGIVVFTLGPRINAAGRIAHGRFAVELLLAQDKDEAARHATMINSKNDLRREVDLSTTEEALAMIEADDILRNARSTVLFKESWHKGVIGIVASRCIEKYHRPTIILTLSENKITGSARSIHGFDLYDAISKCSSLLEKFGGHRYAAGLTLDPANLQAFREKFESIASEFVTDEMLIPAITIDCNITFDLVTSRFFNVLKQMAPFGPGNSSPVFVAENVKVSNSLTCLKEKHIRFNAVQDGSTRLIQAIGFDMAQFYEPLSKGEKFRMAFTIDENRYNGNTTLQLRVKDIQFNKN